MSNIQNITNDNKLQVEKMCGKCKTVKLLSDFYKNKNKKDGYNSNCKECHKKWVVENKERVKKIKRNHYEQNREKIRAMSKKRYNEKQEEVRKYRKENADRIKAYMKKYRSTDAHKKNRSLNRKKRRHTDEKFRLNDLIRKSMDYSLKKGKGKDGKSWKLLVNYSIDELISSLKHKIPKGYTWDDFMKGKLQIDHKIPIAKLNFKKPTDPDFEICWSLKNLQLLSAYENLKKSDKLDKPLQMSLSF